MNTYLGVRTCQGKIVPIKYRFSGLISGKFERQWKNVTWSKIKFKKF